MGRKLRQIQIGTQFGAWTVLSLSGGNGRAYARVHCDCGTEKAVALDNLLDGRSRSCGCRTTHPHATDPMKLRALWIRKRHAGLLDPAWAEDFQSFAEAVKALPGYGTDNARLTRIRTRFRYRPGNVVWKVFP